MNSWTADRDEQTVGMQDEPRQQSTHLTLQLWGFPVAAEDGGSLVLQHALQGSTLRPAHSHQQHLLPTCATQGKSFSHPQCRAQAAAAAWSSPQATHGWGTAKGAAKGLRPGQRRVPAQPQQLCQHGQLFWSPCSDTSHRP